MNYYSYGYEQKPGRIYQFAAIFLLVIYTAVTLSRSST